MKSADLVKALFGFPPDSLIMGNEDGDLEVYEGPTYAGRCLATLTSNLDGMVVVYHYGAERRICNADLPDLETKPYHKIINRRCRRGMGHSGECDDFAKY